MRNRLRTVLAGVALGAIVSLLAPAAPAHAAGRMELSPSRGVAGSSVAVTLIDYGPFCWIKLSWDSPDGQELANVPPWTKDTTITVPADASPGVHTVHTSQCFGRVQATFEVILPPKPTPKPKPRPTPSRPNPSATPSGSPTPTPTGTADVPPVLGGNPPRPTPTVVRRWGGLVLDRDFLRPGETLTARGTGCTPNASVTLVSDGEDLGTATADKAGAFVARARFVAVEPGRRVVQARCGPVLTSDVDVVLATATEGPVSTAVPLVLLMLVGAAAVGCQYAALRRRDTTPIEPD
jgi:hypothetical protein